MWQPYQGDRGGRGWKNSETGEVRYQENKPQPRELFDQYRDSVPNNDPEEFDYESVHRWAEGHAAEHGYDPELIHAGAERHLKRQLEYRASIDPEKVRKSIHSFNEINAAEGKPLHPIPDNPRAANYGNQYRDAYAAAATDQENAVKDRNQKMAAAKFAADYFNQPNGLRRVASYLKKVAEDEVNPHDLDEDTRAAIAEDLAHLPPAKLALHAARMADEWGSGDDSIPFQIAKVAVAAAPRKGRPVPFDGRDSALHKGFLIAKEDLNEDQWAGIQAAAQLAPGAAILSDDAVFVADGNKILDAVAEKLSIDTRSIDSNEPEGNVALWRSLKSPIQVAEADVPASAKNYGKSSGHLEAGKVPDDWDPHRVDNYRRVSGDWFLKIHGSMSPTGTHSEYVHKSDVPPLARLPDTYWDDYDPDMAYTDGDAESRAEIRTEKESAEGAKAKKEGKKLGGEREFTKAAAKIKAEHKKTGNLVRSDEALHDRVTSWAGEHWSGLVPDDEHDGKAKEAAAELEAALKELHESDAPDHSYDVDDVPDFDGSLASYEYGNRTDRTEDLRTTQEEFEKWSEEAKKTTADYREAVAEVSKDYRESVRERLQAIRDAAQALLSLPPDRVSEDNRDVAEQVNRDALKFLARSTRAVNLSDGRGEFDEFIFAGFAMV